MPRLGRRSAASRILASVGEYSDALLARELACFATEAAAWQVGAVAGTKAVKARAKQLPSIAAFGADRPIRDTLDAVFGRSVTAIGAAVGALAGEAVTLAVTSVQRELAVCEATVASSYAGLGDRAGAEVLADSTGLAQAAINSWAGNVEVWRSQWRDAQALQFMYARNDDVDLVVRRLFSPTPVRVLGCGGRGAWWGVLSSVQAASRELAVGLGNRIRSQTMSRWNELAKTV